VEIHSSSLYIAPSGQTAQSTNRSSNAAQSNDALDKSNNAPQRDNSPLSSSDEFVAAAQKRQAQQLATLAPPNTNNEALDTRTAKALDAYASTYNQIPQQQIASTITGIDFYA